MASMKASKPQAQTQPKAPKFTAAGAAKPAPKKAAQKPINSKVPSAVTSPPPNK